jgi:hypothetical protein
MIEKVMPRIHVWPSLRDDKSATGGLPGVLLVREGLASPRQIHQPGQVASYHSWAA